MPSLPILGKPTLPDVFFQAGLSFLLCAPLAHLVYHFYNSDQLHIHWILQTSGYSITAGTALLSLDS